MTPNEQRLYDIKQTAKRDAEILETELALSGYDFTDAEEIAHALKQVRRWAMCLRVVQPHQKKAAQAYFNRFVNSVTTEQLLRVAAKPEQYDYLALWADCEALAREL